MAATQRVRRCLLAVSALSTVLASPSRASEVVYVEQFDYVRPYVYTTGTGLLGVCTARHGGQYTVLFRAVDGRDYFEHVFTVAVNVPDNCPAGLTIDGTIEDETPFTFEPPGTPWASNKRASTTGRTVSVEVRLAVPVYDLIQALADLRVDRPVNRVLLTYRSYHTSTNQDVACGAGRYLAIVANVNGTPMRAYQPAPGFVQTC